MAKQRKEASKDITKAGYVDEKVYNVPVITNLESEQNQRENEPTLSVSDTPEIVSESMRIKDILKGEHERPPDTDKYWIGCVDDAPYHGFHFGGISFPKSTNTPKLDVNDGVFKPGPEMFGVVEEMNGAKVKQVLAAIENTVIRMGPRPIKINTKDGRTDREYYYQANDVAVGRWIWFRKYRAGMGTNFIPETLLPATT